MGRRIAVVGISGNGKTTLARKAAAKLGVPYVELDRLNHRPGWNEASAEELRAAADEATRGDAWVADGGYFGKIGMLVVARADEVVWLEQPLLLVLRRLLKRCVVDIVTKRDMFNGNRQTWRGAFWGREALVPYAVRAHFRHRRTWPTQFAAVRARVTHLRSPREVAAWLDSLGDA